MFNNQLGKVLQVKFETKKNAKISEEDRICFTYPLTRQYISQGKAEDTLLFSFPPVEDRKDLIEKDTGTADPGITLHDIY